MEKNLAEGDEILGELVSYYDFLHKSHGSVTDEAEKK